MSSIEISKIKTGHKEKNYIFFSWSETPTLFGGYGVSHDIFNATDKKIKYATFAYEPINHFGDAVAKTQVALYTGPLSSKEKTIFMTEPLWFLDEEKQYRVRLVKVEIEYTDGSKEEIDGKDITFIEKEKSSYQSMIKAEKDTKEKKDKEDRKARGSVIFAGKTDSNKYIVFKDDSITFYLLEETMYTSSTIHLVGWESTKTITHLNLPSNVEFVDKQCLKNTCIKSVMFPRSMKQVSYWRRDRVDLNLNINDVQKIVIPKETEEFLAKPELMGSIREIEFEDPCGWGVSKKIITDPKKMYEYIVEKGEVQLHKSFLKKILYKLGL